MYNKKNMVFFFDESFHSRKINKKTVEDKEFFDNYVMVGIGCKRKELYQNEILYDEFEKKFKSKLSINEESELKSKVVKKEQYKYGLKSFNKKSLELYKEFWELMNQSSYIYYICTISKLEYILTQFDYITLDKKNYQSMIYSIVKAVNVYRPENVLLALFEENNLLLEELIIFFKRKILENEKNPIKIYENEAFKKYIAVLERINGENINFKWEYNNVFVGFKKFINELSINNIRIILDKEGNLRSNTANACRKEGFKNVEEKDSKNSITIRCVDLMCGFVSKMMRAIYEDTRIIDDEKYTDRKIINREWFYIDEERFLIYKNIAKYFRKYDKIFWNTYISIYFDAFFQFIELLYYFDEFENFEEFNKIQSDNHRENYNTFVLNHMTEKFIKYGWIL